MPRFIAHLRETRVFRRYVHLPMSAYSYDQFIEACSSYPKPNPFPADWCITAVDDEHAYRLPPSIIRARSLADEDEWAMGIQCSISAEASVLVYAKNEKAAHASILRDMKCYEGNRVHRSDSNGWNGWHLADDVEILSIEQDRHGKPLRHKFEIPVDLLASPDQSWFRYEPDQILEAFRWLAISGAGYNQKCTWHEQKLSHLLSRGYSNNPFHSHELKPIISLKDLKSRFQYALLAGGYDFYGKWREDVGYQLGKTLKIDAPHRAKSYRDIATGPVHTMTEALDQMLVESRQMKLAWSLNSCHPDAIEIQTIGLSVSDRGFAFILRYGYPNDGSHWDFVLATTRGNEPLAETLNRAYVHFGRLVPDFKAQRQAQREEKWKREREERGSRLVEPECV